MADNMVVASQPLAGQAGLSMLAKGGNAVDAALATAIALTQVEPTGNGLGSDAFAIVWDGKELHGLNSSGCAPASWTPDRFHAMGGIPDRGWETVTVPGAVRAWSELHQRFGKLPFETLFEPAIRYAEKGFIVSPIIGKLWHQSVPELKDQPGFSHFMPDGHLASHTSEWCGTISKSFDDFTLHEIPPNGQGISACMALGMLSHTNIRNFQADDPRALHLMFEAMKLAFRDAAAYVSDQRYMSDVTAADLLNDDYLESRAALIDSEQAQDFNSGQPSGSGTVCLSAADENGMMVSFIQSNYAGFGSGVVVPGTGIHLQNRACGFTLADGHPNQIGGGKRPFHTIIPGFIMGADAPRMAFGLMGGMMQAQGHVQMALRTQR